MILAITTFQDFGCKFSTIFTVVWRNFCVLKMKKQPQFVLYDNIVKRKRNKKVAYLISNFTNIINYVSLYYIPPLINQRYYLLFSFIIDGSITGKCPAAVDVSAHTANQIWVLNLAI